MSFTTHKEEEEGGGREEENDKKGETRDTMQLYRIPIYDMLH